MIFASLMRHGLFLCGGLILLTSIVRADAVPTRLDGSPGHWQLLRDGTPYFIRGAGGDGSMQLLKDCGGNSVRCWGVGPELGPRLDEAQRLGLTVCVGLWLGHEDRINHFNYSDPKQVSAQLDKCRQAILQYKNHPAVLMWGIGNEMEGNGSNEKIFAAVNDIAKMAKQLDPNHVTMTVIADLGKGGVKVKNVARLCPDIDLIGINTYGGALTLTDRLAATGVTRPYVVTEFGPLGFWETKPTAFGAAVEATSSDKAAVYANGYAKAVAAAPGQCLGSYAFLWGHKQEKTATWFGMLLADGTPTNAVATMRQIWSGRPPALAPPQIRPITLDGPDQVKPGDTVHATVDVTSPQAEPLAIEWTLRRDAETFGEGGSYEPPTQTYADAIVAHDGSTATVKLPEKPGVYRLYVVARDRGGYAATANVPVLVKGGK